VTEHDEDGYQGPATLHVEDAEVAVDVVLGGNFEPIDGKYHWYGRIQANDELTELLGTSKAAATIRTPHGAADGRLADPDPWGRYRISGAGRPPFFVPTTLEDLGQH
jgi:Domain of unknown function (DUF4873)